MRTASSKELAAELFKAASAGNASRVCEILVSGAKPDQRVTGEPTALIAAARRGNIEVVRALISAGANPSFQHGGKTGTSALLEAIRHNQFLTGCELVAAGADVHHDWSGKGQNITYEALRKCNELYRTAFPREGTDLFGLTSKKETKEVRETAARHYPDSLKLLEKILGAGGKPRAEMLIRAAASGNLPAVRSLISAGLDVNDGGGSEETAFSASVGNGQLETAVELLKLGANPSIGKFLLSSAVHAAVVAGQMELIKAVIRSGADLNGRGTVTLHEPISTTLSAPKRRSPQASDEGFVEFAKAEDSTLLIVAVRANQPRIAQMLLNAGVDTEAVDRNGFTALAWAIKLKLKSFEEMLRRSGAKEPKSLSGSPSHELFEACRSGDVEKVREAIAGGADVNGVTEGIEERLTPLMIAANKGSLPIVDALLLAGANPNLGGREEMFSLVAPIMLAARQGHDEIVKRLLAAGALADAAGRDLISIREVGDGAVHEAARKGHASVVKLLLDAGVKPNAQSAWSKNVLSAAVESGNLETVQVVLAAGAKLTARNRTGLLAEAMAANHQDIVNELYAAYAVNAGPVKGAK